MVQPISRPQPPYKGQRVTSFTLILTLTLGITQADLCQPDPSVPRPLRSHSLCPYQTRLDKPRYKHLPGALFCRAGERGYFNPPHVSPNKVYSVSHLQDDTEAEMGRRQGSPTQIVALRENHRLGSSQVEPLLPAR